MLALAHAFLGDQEEALKVCEQGLHHNANDPLMLSGYGWTCGTIGRRQEAESTVADLQQRRRERWTPSAGQLIDVAKWNLLRYIPVNMGEAEDDEEETTQSFPSL